MMPAHGGGAAALAARFQAAVAAEDWDGAAAALQGLIALAPRDASLHYNRAVALRRGGRADEASKAAAEALRLRPEHDNALFEHASALMDAGRHADARAAFEFYLSRQPDDADAKTNLAALLVRAGEPARAHALAPNTARGRVVRAEALRDQGDLDAMEVALADAPPALALKIRTHGPHGRLPLDPRRLGRA